MTPCRYPSERHNVQLTAAYDSHMTQDDNACLDTCTAIRPRDTGTLSIIGRDTSNEQTAKCVGAVRTRPAHQHRLGPKSKSTLCTKDSKSIGDTANSREIQPKMRRKNNKRYEAHGCLP